MTVKPVILAPREPLTDSAGNISRSWWRTLNTLFQQSGTTATPLVTVNSVLFNAAELSSGGTISTPNLTAESLIGNPAATAAQPVSVAVSDNFAFSAGTLDLAPLPAGTLLGNGGYVSAAPGEVDIGSNLTLASGTLDVSADGALIDQSYAYSIRDTRGEVGSVGSLAADALTLALLGGSATTPSATGTITVAAHSLFGNAGTVASTGTNIAIGAGLTLASSGTLSATGGGIYAPLVNGTLPGPVLIADPFGQCVMVQIR